MKCRTGCVVSVLFAAACASAPRAEEPARPPPEMFVPERTLLFSAGLPHVDVLLPTRLHDPVDVSAAAEAKRDAAIEDIRTLLPRVGGDGKGELVARLAFTYLEKGTYAQAQAKKDPASAISHLKMGRAYDQQGYRNLAYVSEVHPSSPARREYAVESAIALIEMKTPIPGVAVLQQLRAAGGDDAPLAALILGDMSFGRGELDDARGFYVEACQTPRRDDVCQYAAERLLHVDAERSKARERDADE
jgi:tetratricopeptide (TPR) repeat protein